MTSARVVALLLAAACPGLARSQAQPTSASRVCVLNNGSIDLSFELWNTAGNSLSSASPTLTSGEQSWQSCLELSAIAGIEPGNPVVAVVKATMGTSHSMPPVLYSPASSDAAAAATATFSCVAAAEDISCDLNGEAVTWQPGTLFGVPASEQVRASKICVQNSGDFSMTARLWDTATGALGNWSAAFWSVKCRGCRASVGGINGWSAEGQSAVVCFDGSSLPGLASGHPLVVVASPEGAKPGPSLVRSVVYDPDVTTPVMFECWGHQQSYSCVFRGASTRRLRGSSAAAAPASVLV